MQSRRERHRSMRRFRSVGAEDVSAVNGRNWMAVLMMDLWWVRLQLPRRLSHWRWITVSTVQAAMTVSYLWFCCTLGSPYPREVVVLIQDTSGDQKTIFPCKRPLYHFKNYCSCQRDVDWSNLQAGQTVDSGTAFKPQQHVWTAHSIILSSESQAKIQKLGRDAFSRIL